MTVTVIRQVYGQAIVLCALAIASCASADNARNDLAREQETASTRVAERNDAERQACGYSGQASDAIDGGVAKILEPPYMYRREQSLVPQQHIREYTNEPYVLRFQIFEVDARQFREFLVRESKVAREECWATVLLQIFDDEPVEIFRDTLVIPGKGIELAPSAWVGRSRGESQYSLQFVVAPDDSVSMKIESNSEEFQFNQTKSLPYHVLWEWDTEFFGSPE